MRRLILSAATGIVLLSSQTQAGAYCANFVCMKGETCHYHVVSSAGPARNVNLYYGHEIALSGLGSVTSYCDWRAGRCVTPMRAVQSLSACQ